MLIKLQPDQVGLLWDMIRFAIVDACGVPKELQQDFTNKMLGQLMSGLAQCWIGYELDDKGDKKIHFIVTTKVVGDDLYGLRTLVLSTLHGFRFISNKLIDEAISKFEEYARANKCGIMTAESSSRSAGEFLLKHGFEEHRVAYRRFVH